MYRLPPRPDPGPERSPRRGRPPRALGVLLAVVVAALAGCDDPATQVGGQGQQGPVRVTLVSPNGIEGAALFELPIEGVLEVKAPVGAFFESRVGGKRQVAVFASQAAALSLDLTVEDQSKLPEVRLLQVSGADDQPRTLTGYRVQVEVPR
jgi:hypothetical protein